MTETPNPFTTLDDRFRQEDIYLAIAAPSHEELRRFISAYCRSDTDMGLAEDEDADTPCPDARIWTCQHSNHRVHLLELPTFNNDLTNGDNVPALRNSASILAGAYVASHNTSILRGILYFGDENSAPTTLKQLISETNITYVSLASSDDADTICAPFLAQQAGPVLPIQTEFLPQGKPLRETTAGAAIFSAIEKRLSAMGDDAQTHDLYTSLKQALASMDDNWNGVAVRAAESKLEEATAEAAPAARSTQLRGVRIMVKVDPNDPDNHTNKNGVGWDQFLHLTPPQLPRFGGITWLGVTTPVVAGAALCNVM